MNRWHLPPFTPQLPLPIPRNKKVKSATLALMVLCTLQLNSPSQGGETAITATPSPQPAALKEVLDKKFSSYSCYTVQSPAPGSSLNKRAAQPAQLHLQLGADHDWHLSLEPEQVRSTTYRLRSLTAAGSVEHQTPPLATYRGALLNTPGSSVRITIKGEQIMGSISTGTEHYFIEPTKYLHPTAPASQVVVYRDEDVKEELELSCGGVGIEDPAISAAPSLSKQAAAAAQPCKVAELALAAHSSMYKAYGSAADVEARIVSILNMVNELYADPRVNIKHELVELIVDETGSTDMGGLTNLNTEGFISWVQSGPFKNKFDVAGGYYHSLGGGTVGRARLAAVCQSGGVHMIRNFTTSLKSMFLDHAHELGHNWGSNHVDDKSCLMYPSILGTNEYWCDGAINAITVHKASRSCLSSCDQPPLADFSVTDSTSCNGSIQFSDLSRYNPTSWSWDFGDGATSSEREPVHNYLKNGTYTVTLTVSNAFGNNSKTKTAWLKINAPDVPTLSTTQPQCQNGQVTLSASGSRTVKWFATPAGGLPLHEGASFTTTLNGSAQTFYLQNAEADLPIKTIGPIDTSDGKNGAYKEDAGTQIVYMAFKALKLARLRSITVYSNRAGKRHFVLTAGNLTTALQELVIDVPVGKMVIDFNWDLQPNQLYWLALENTEGVVNEESPQLYINNLYRSREGIAYPQRIDGLLEITSNYWRDGNEPTSTSWYLGYDWKVQEISACGSARIGVTVTADCKLGAQPLAAMTKANLFAKLTNSTLTISLGQAPADQASVSLFTLQGKLLLHQQLHAAHQVMVLGGMQAGLAAGSYLLSVQNGGASQVLQIIKQ